MLDWVKRKIAALTTDDVPQGINNIYLSETGGLTDNLATMPNFNIVSTTLNDHLSNDNNPHSEILSGLRTHQTQITLSQNITLNQSTYIDSLLVQASNSNDFTITIPNEGGANLFATHAAFTAFRLGLANLSVVADAGVTFLNAPGSVITLPTPGNSYYLFIRQNQNEWAVVTFNSNSSGGIAKVNVTSSPIAMNPNTQYVTNYSGVVEFTLPLNGTCNINDEIIVIGNGAWEINQNSGQIIKVGIVSTTPGTGVISSTNNYNCIKLVCTAVSPTTTEFTAMVDQGNVLIQ